MRIDALTPGSLVTLRFCGYGADFEDEVARFVGIFGEGDDRRARFESTREPHDAPFEWDAYRFNRRWSYGSSAQVLRLIGVHTS